MPNCKIGTISRLILAKAGAKAKAEPKVPPKVEAKSGENRKR